MCFSANASFIAAAITGSIGFLTVTRVSEAREIPLAAMPMLFAVQQTVEGALWLTLPNAPGGNLSSALTYAFLSFALAIWPVYAPVAAWLVEPEVLRRRAMAACALVGAGVAAYFAFSVLNAPHTACIVGSHIAYKVGTAAPYSVGGLYLLATGLALCLSSHRAVALMGAIVLLGSVVSDYAYHQAYVSVWCYFAAASSVLLLAHFARTRSLREAAARSAAA
jgi:hypothetical protein